MPCKITSTIARTFEGVRESESQNSVGLRELHHTHINGAKLPIDGAMHEFHLLLAKTRSIYNSVLFFIYGENRGGKK